MKWIQKKLRERWFQAWLAWFTVFLLLPHPWDYVWAAFYFGFMFGYMFGHEAGLKFMEKLYDGWRPPPPPPDELEARRRTQARWN